MERRIQRTQKLLRRGFAYLLQSKPFCEITVSELVKVSDINRSTFYLHYKDIYDFMESTQTELYEQLQKVAQEYLVPPFAQNGLHFFEDVFEILFENKEIYTALMGKNGNEVFLTKIQQMISDYSLQALRVDFPDGKKDAEYTLAFCANGCFGLIKEWLMNGCVDSPQHMTQLTFQMIHSIVSPNNG